jgi:adenylylsulfate kinase
MEVVVLSGTVGAGKTTVAGALRRELVARGYAVAELDVDAVAAREPAPHDDPFNERLVVAHLGALRERWEARGVEVLVLPRVVETTAQRASYARALDQAVRVVRVDAPATSPARRATGTSPGRTCSRRASPLRGSRTSWSTTETGPPTPSQARSPTHWGGSTVAGPASCVQRRTRAASRDCRVDRGARSDGRRATTTDRRTPARAARRPAGTSGASESDPYLDRTVTTVVVVR